MKCLRMVGVCLILAVLAATSEARAQKFPILTGEYLGQDQPGLAATPFATDLLIRPLGLSFTPDGSELYYASWQGDPRVRIMVMRLVDGRWTESATVPFSGTYEDWDLNLSPAGRRLYFSSKRPLTGDGEPRSDSDIWYVETDASGGWGEPQNLGPPVNTEENEVHPTVTSDGTIYFFAGYERGMGSADIYRSRLVDGQYTMPENLGAPINTAVAEMDPFVAPDERYLVFHSRAEGGYGENDLYVSFRLDDGSWGAPVNMGPKVNSDGNDYCGRFSFDERFFFFTSTRDETRSTYWIDASVLEELRASFHPKPDA
jgi:Tol biopolymer transport system component